MKPKPHARKRRLNSQKKTRSGSPKRRKSANWWKRISTLGAAASALAALLEALAKLTKLVLSLLE